MVELISKKRKTKIDDDDDDVLEKLFAAPESNAAAAKFMSIVTDDLLLEILIRLPDCRSIIQCSSVCKRWFSVISYRKYFIRTRFIDHSQQKPEQFLPCTVVFKYNHISAIYKKPFYQFFSEPSKILHGKSSSCTSNYLNFLPWPVLTKGSSKDLLHFSRSITEYYICNPLTRQWLPLPETPPNIATRCGIVCDPKSSLNTRYRVVLIYDDLGKQVNQFEVGINIFYSETGQWNPSTLLFSRNTIILSLSRVGWHRRAVASNGILYWLCGNNPELEGIVAFVPFNGTDHLKRWCLIQFPVGFCRGWRGQGLNLRIGVVQGRLRLSQMYRFKRVLGFVLKIWELVNCDYDNGDASCLLVHNVILAGVKANKMLVAAFHPVNGDVIFLFRDLDICQYDIGGEKIEKVDYAYLGAQSRFQAWLLALADLDVEIL
ncbi:F-box domain containing protein [Parasponia andersonii]|uniref:F-box domain containing protein n=1 Tax=Parasponia andersonii TaxID=3476 RepID=A0A2P5D5Y3_PARAD|nr:F-box domain containing protein [Parasponia andersonii]